MFRFKYAFDPIPVNPKTLMGRGAPFTKKLPFYVTQLGMLDQYKKHFTLREGERNSYQIMFTTEGAGKITYLDKTIELGPNQICVINKYKYHYYETAKCGHWKYYHLSVSGDSLKPFCDLLYNGGFSAIDITDPDKAMKYWQKIWNLVKAGTLSANIKASLTAYEFLTYILELKLFPAKQPGAKHNFMDTMAVIDNYITDHLNEKITLEDLAKISYLSPRHLSRKFESQMGMTPHKYVTSVRINEGKRLLIFSDMTIADIAAKLGYPSSSGFIIQFKSIVGQTPKSYRNQT